MHFQLEIIRHEPISFRLFHLRPHRCRSSLFSKKELTTFFPYVYFFFTRNFEPKFSSDSNNSQWLSMTDKATIRLHYNVTRRQLDLELIFTRPRECFDLIWWTQDRENLYDWSGWEPIRKICKLNNWTALNAHTPSNRLNQNNHYYTSLNIPLWRLDSRQVSRSSQLIVHRYLSSSPVNRSTRLSIRRYIELRR